MRVVVPPASEPVSLQEAKDHLRVVGDAEDPHIAGLIVAARELVESRARRSLVTRTLEVDLDGWPDGPIVLPRPPLVAVERIAYAGESGAVSILDPGSYRARAGTPGRVLRAGDAAWPALGEAEPAVTVRYRAGYGGPEDVRATTRLAIKLLVGHWFEHREAAAEATVGGGVAVLPLGVSALLNPERC